MQKNTVIVTFSKIIAPNEHSLTRATLRKSDISQHNNFQYTVPLISSTNRYALIYYCSSLTITSFLFFAF